MIVDKVEHFQQYSKCIPEIYEVIKFAEKVKKENIPVGKYPLQNGFILVQEGTTRKFEEADFEVHRKYIDIQLLISGTEYVEYADIRDLTTKVQFDEEKDLELMAGSGSKIEITPNTFYILYPNDGHKPCCHAQVPTNYKKILAKIEIDKLVQGVDISVTSGKSCTIKPKFQGGYGIVLTPFKQDGSVDYVELKKQLNVVCDSDITGVVVCGSTSEFTYLSREETKEIMTFSKQVVGERKEFICGATAANCHETKGLLKFIEQLGADGALVAPPYYFPLGDNDVLDFYTDIANEPGNLPIIAYQIPQCTSGISMKVFKEIIKLPRIEGIKNSSGNALQIMQQITLRNEVRKDFAVLTGSDESIYALVNCGADGSFTAIGYLYPDLIANVYKNLKNEIGLKYQQDVVKLAGLAGSIPYPLGYRILGEASGTMNFGKYMQAVAPERMKEYEAVKCQMQEILKSIK